MAALVSPPPCFPSAPPGTSSPEASDRAAQRTVMFVAHHDAAHSGLVFHPALGRIAPRFLPRLHERSKHTLPILYGVWLGPVLACAGALLGGRRALRGRDGGIGCDRSRGRHRRPPVVPGANDNLAAVGILLAIAERTRREPPHGVRV